MTRRIINMFSYLYQYHWLSMDKCPISIVYGFIYLYTVATRMQVSNCCLKVVKTMSSISSCVRENLRGLWSHDVGSNCEVSLTWGQLIWDPWRHHVVFLFNVLSPWFFIVVVYIFRVLNSKRLQHDGFWRMFTRSFHISLALLWLRAGMWRLFSRNVFEYAQTWKE